MRAEIGGMTVAEDEYVIRLGWGNNEVRDAGYAYLDAAEAIYLSETQRADFMVINNWYVVHHLSVIAAELLMKACKVTYKNVEWSEDGPSNYEVEHAYCGHKFQPDEIHKDDWKQLQKHLSPEQVNLLASISDGKAAGREISRGRYPYETHNGSAFPSGPEGRLEAEEWLDLARALAKFEGVEPAYD